MDAFDTTPYGPHGMLLVMEWRLPLTGWLIIQVVSTIDVSNIQNGWKISTTFTPHSKSTHTHTRKFTLNYEINCTVRMNTDYGYSNAYNTRTRHDTIHKKNKLVVDTAVPTYEMQLSLPWKKVFNWDSGAYFSIEINCFFIKKMLRFNTNLTEKYKS